MTTDKGPDKLLDPEVTEAIEDGLRAHRDAHGKRQLADPSAARRDVELATGLEKDIAGYSNVHYLSASAKPAPADQYDGDQLKEDLIRFGLPCDLFDEDSLNRPIKS